MKKRMLSLALCLVLVVGLFSGLTVNASAGRLDDLKKEIAEKLIKEKIEQLKEEFEIPDLDTEAILNSFGAAATSALYLLLSLALGRREPREVLRSLRRHRPPREKGKTPPTC